MKAEALTIRILKLLAGMEYATTEAIIEHVKLPRFRVLNSLRDMRERRKTVATDERGHSITKWGREFLMSPNPTRPMRDKRAIVEPSRPQSEFLLAKPTQITVSEANSVMRRPTWAPEPWIPARPGADDHKRYASRGII